MTDSDVETVLEIYREWNAGRTGLRHFHPDVVWSVPHTDGTEVRGMDAVRTWMASFQEVWESWEHEVAEARDMGGGVVFVVFLEHATGRATGLPVDERGGAIWTVRDGRVAEYRAFLREAEAREALARKLGASGGG